MVVFKSFFIRTFGCQMNVVDSEIVETILIDSGFSRVSDMKDADIILFNTCSIRGKAEQSLLKQVIQIKHNKKKIIGILGCMAQRLKEDLLKKNENINFVVGPDEYRKIPDIIASLSEKIDEKHIQVNFIKEEFYDYIHPQYENNISAFAPIIRGCNNFCSYCVVPYTRGREKSRDVDSIIDEIKYLQSKKYKEIILLGENVNSYKYVKDERIYDFADLLKVIAEVADNMRIRFTSSHPKDINKKLIETMKEYPNICRHIHLPVQSGSNRILKLMHRPYSCEEYCEKVDIIRNILPECSITTDIMCGFCDEKEEDHKQTLQLIGKIKFDSAFTFAYSERSGTYSANFLQDNIAKNVKIRRLNEIIAQQHEISIEKNAEDIGKTFEILVEGCSKRNKNEYFGRTSQNKVVIFNNKDKKYNIGDFVELKIIKSTSATLFGEK